MAFQITDSSACSATLFRLTWRKNKHRSFALYDPLFFTLPQPLDYGWPETVFRILLCPYWCPISWLLALAKRKRTSVKGTYVTYVVPLIWPMRAEFICRNKKVQHFIVFLMVRLIHGIQWHVDNSESILPKSQGISDFGIDIIFPGYFDLSTRASIH